MRTPKLAGRRPSGAPADGAGLPGKPAGIADVARLAGVSTATVSRTLANPAVVSGTTRERVLEAVRRTGYTPNVAGRNLRARRSMMVLVVMPTVENLVFAEVLRGIDHRLADAGYGLIIGNLDGTPDREQRFVELAFSGQVDGVLLVNGYVPSSGSRAITQAGRPVAAVSVPIHGAGFPQVVVQDREGAEAAVAHLVDHGHRRLTYLSGHGPIDDERRAGFRTATRAAGLPDDAAPVIEGDFSFGAGAAAARHVLTLAQRPTGVFAASDAMAVGFINTVRRTGLRVPDDMSVIGFDGVDYADYCDPPLTTVVQPRLDMGREAAELLVKAMTAKGSDTAATAPIRLPVRLLCRGSTGPAPLT